MNNPAVGLRPQPVFFVETRDFTETWSDLRLGADDLIGLQDFIALNPKAHPVIAATGGLRKVRFAPRSLKKGKRGALRVCYVYFERLSAIVLVLAYPKNQKDDLSPAEKKTIRVFLKALEVELRKRLGD